MLLEVPFTARDVANTRFAVSPLWEVVASVRILQAPGDHPLHRPWSQLALDQLRRAGLDWTLLAELVPVPTVRIPAFVCPPPATSAPNLGLELTTLQAMSPDRVRTDVAPFVTAHTPRLRDLVAEPERGVAELVDVIRAYWELTIAPHWPRMASLLDGDVLYRARLLAERGPGELFNDLDPNITWDGDTLYVTRRRVPRHAELNRRGLLLVPSVFTYPRVFSVTSAEWQPTLRYPPRGIGTLWQRRAVNVPEALGALVGRSRALLLSELAEPASTQELARRTGLSPGGVSQHLTTMRTAGLVTAHRTGRFVLYARSRVAEALLDAAASQ